MSITPERKQELIKEFAICENDTGSVEVQCAVLTDRIVVLTKHIQSNHKDHSSRRGLLKLVGRRKRFFRYLQNTQPARYKALISRLGLRK